jgi:hypothetical protein
VKANGALFFFDPMFGDPEPFCRQVHHLTPLWHFRWLLTQILLAVLTALDGMNEHLIGRHHLLEVMPPVALLPTGLLAALVSQALRRTNEAIGGGRQPAIMAILGLLPFERLHTLLEILNPRVAQREMVMEDPRRLMSRKRFG